MDGKQPDSLNKAISNIGSLLLILTGMALLILLLGAFTYGVSLMSTGPLGDQTCTKGICLQQAGIHETRWQGLWAMDSAILTLFTLAAVAFGFWQARETQRKEYRAYIRLEDCPKLRFVQKGRMVLSCSLTNYGRTPAYDLRCNFEMLTKYEVKERIGVIEYCRNEQAASFEVPNIHPGPEVPRQILTTKGRFANKIELEDAYRLHQADLALIASVSYRDVFRQSHCEQFRFNYKGIVPKTGLLRPNYSDENLAVFEAAEEISSDVS